MKFIKIKTRAFLPPKDDIYDLLNYIKKLNDGDVVVITSKVLSIHQGRTIKISPSINKTKLVKQEAEYYKLSKLKQQKFILTIKEHTLAISSGIDESNANGYYILWPKNVVRLLKELRTYLMEKHKIKNLGIIATDSRTFPMRRGTIGVAIGAYGFEPLKDYRNTNDIFGRKFKYSQVNIADALAISSVYLMGEGSERVPIILIKKSNLKFTNKPTFHKLTMPLMSDIYYPILKIFKKS